MSRCNNHIWLQRWARNQTTNGNDKANSLGNKNILKCQLRNRTRMSVLRTYVWSTEWYGLKLWSFKNSTPNHHCVRNEVLLPNIKHILDESIEKRKVHKRLGVEKLILLDAIQKRKLHFPQHVLRGTSLEKQSKIITGDAT